jgi:hypothetical protein
MRICLVLATVLALAAAASTAERERVAAILVSPIHEAQVVRGDDGAHHLSSETVLLRVGGGDNGNSV